MHATSASVRFYTWLTKDLGYSPHDERLRPHAKSFDCLSASNEDFQEELMRHTVSPSEYARTRKILRIIELQKQKTTATHLSTQILVGDQPSKTLDLVQSSLTDINGYVKCEERTRNQLSKIIHLTQVNNVLGSVVKSLKAFQGASGSALVNATCLSETVTYENSLLSAQEQAVRQFTTNTTNQIANILRQLKNEMKVALRRLKMFLRDDEEIFDDSEGAHLDTHPRLGPVYKASLCNIKEGDALLAELDRLHARESDLLSTYCDAPLDLTTENVTSQVVNYSINKAPQLGAILLKAEIFGLKRCISFLQDYSRELENRGRRTQYLVEELALAMNKTNTLKQKANDQLHQIEYLTESIQQLTRKIEATATERSREEHRQLLNEKLDRIWSVFSDIHASLDKYSSLSVVSSFRDLYMYSLASKELKLGISSNAILTHLKEIITTGATILLSQDSVLEKVVAEERRHRQAISSVVHSDDILPELCSHQLRDSIESIQSVYELIKILKHSERRFSTSVFIRTCLLRHKEVQSQVFDALHSLLTRINSYKETMKSVFSKKVINNHMTDAYLAPTGVTKLGGTSNPHLKLDKSTGIVQGVKIAQLDGWLMDTCTLLEQRKIMDPKIFSSLISNKLSMFYKSVAPYLLRGESFNSAIAVSTDNLIQSNRSQLTSLQNDLSVYSDIMKELEYVISVMKDFYSVPL